MIDRMAELRFASAAQNAGNDSRGSEVHPARFAQAVSLDENAGSASFVEQNESLQRFFAEVDSVRRGPLQELESLLKESKALHDKALNTTTPVKEREALSKVEACSQAASLAAARTTKALQGLNQITQSFDGAEEASLRRQAFAGISMLLQRTLNAHFQAQQEFKSKMEDRVRRHLQAAMPTADDEAIAAIVAGAPSGTTAVQDTVRSTAGEGMLDPRLALKATRERVDELEKLNKAAAQLKQAFFDVQVLVEQQGEVINDIAHHVETTRTRTAAAAQQLEMAVDSNASCRRRWCCVVIVVLVIALILFLFFGNKSSLFGTSDFAGGNVPGIRTPSFGASERPPALALRTMRVEALPVRSSFVVF